MIRSLIASTLILLASFSITTAQVNIQDSLALVALYDATNGDQWKNNSNWLFDPVSTWYGITLQGDRVYVISLYDNGLEGYIPDEIGELTGLVEIDLSLGNFTGGIPNVFWDMPNFYQLSLRNCGLTGEIPSSLGSCPQFARLTVTGNQLTGTVPPSLAACTGLMHLLISSNNLSGPFPPVIESFEHLEQLEISRNDFSGPIPEWVASMEGLWWFFIDDNHFSGPVPFLGDKPNLTHLNISNNPLTGNLEDILGSYPTLQYGNIDNTDITGELSPSHFNPDHLVSLEARGNQLHVLGDFSAWANKPNFIRLNVSSNHLDFDDLLPNSGLPSNKFYYSPQGTIGNDTIVTLLPGEEYAIYSPMQDDDILYQWYFNQMLIEGPENYDLILPPFSSELVGDFYFKATHAALPGLTLQSGITTLVEGTTATGVLENSFLHVFPNPTHDDIVLISAPETLPHQIRLYSSDGHLLQSRIVQDHQTDLSLQGYPSGVYLLQLSTVNDTIMTKIIKQ